MILCPFCGSEMPDEARSCPSCRSVLVERKEAGRKREQRAWFLYARHSGNSFRCQVVQAGG